MFLQNLFVFAAGADVGSATTSRIALITPPTGVNVSKSVDVSS
jgi:hypothetical protein